jgi:putative transposase
MFNPPTLGFLRHPNLQSEAKMRYRRTGTPGGTYFGTVNLAERKRTFLVDHIDDLRAVVKKVQTAHPFHIDAMVVLPDHLHAIWTLPEGDTDYPKRWSLIKAGFSRRVPTGERRNRSRMTKGERGIWQRRYWEHLIRDDRDFGQHADYIHYNPVKHGYVSRAGDWPYSSFHRYVRVGIYRDGWGGENDLTPTGSFGE